MRVVVLAYWPKGSQVIAIKSICEFFCFLFFVTSDPPLSNSGLSSSLSGSSIFELSAKAETLYKKMKAFMEKHIYPAEEVCTPS